MDRQSSYDPWSWSKHAADHDELQPAREDFLQRPMHPNVTLRFHWQRIAMWKTRALLFTASMLGVCMLVNPIMSLVMAGVCLFTALFLMRYIRRQDARFQRSSESHLLVWEKDPEFAMTELQKFHMCGEGRLFHRNVRRESAWRVFKSMVGLGLGVWIASMMGNTPAGLAALTVGISYAVYAWILLVVRRQEYALLKKERELLAEQVPEVLEREHELRGGLSGVASRTSGGKLSMKKHDAWKHEDRMNIKPLRA